MGFWIQFSMLLWKNYLQQKRQRLLTFLEIILPTIFTLILIVVRHGIQPKVHNFGNNYVPFEPNIIPFWPTKIGFAPSTPDTIEIMKRVPHIIHSHDIAACNLNATSCTLQKVETFEFASDQEMERHITQRLEEDVATAWLGGIAFDMNPNKSFCESLSYKIRLSDTSRSPLSKFADQSTSYTPMESDVGWITDKSFPLVQHKGPREAKDSFGGKPGYFYEGFLALQYAVDMSFISYCANQSLSSDILINLWRYPYPEYTDDRFFTILETTLPIVIMLGYVLSVLSITRNIVLEKEKKLKQYMVTMGLKNYVQWCAHFVWNFFFLMLTNVIIVVLLCVRFSDSFSVIRYSDASILFIFLTLYSTAAISFCFAVSSLFNKGNIAAAVAGMLWFVSYFPFVFVQSTYASMGLTAKLAFGFIINVAMSQGTLLFAVFETEGTGMTYSTIHVPPVSENKNADLSLAFVLSMLVVDSLICLVFGWYVETVFPGQGTLGRPWYFPLTLSYWTGVRVSPQDLQRLTSVIENGAGDNLEPEPINLDPVIQMYNLTKIFGSGSRKKTAVDNINLTVYKGQITALLGRNGAGKTTLISMLSGLFPPTHGTAFVDGFDIRTSMAEIQAHMGICPQYNILFDNLTTLEHLQLFARKVTGIGGKINRDEVTESKMDAKSSRSYLVRFLDLHAATLSNQKNFSSLKGSPDFKNEAKRVLNSILMSSKVNTLANNLSGGQKRRLSLGIALVGNSKVVFLDEPTAGMDPGARRSTWNLLQKERVGRSIILTTHYMEEADLLGDRIAIVAKGLLKCCGSSLFLKNRYGAGYRLSVVFNPYCAYDVDSVSNIVKAHIPGGELHTNAGLESTYTLPQFYVGKFQGLFKHLETCQSYLGISSFGVCVTTIEDVFLRINENNDEGLCTNHNKEERPSGVSTESSSTNGSHNAVEVTFQSEKLNTGWQLLRQQFCALMYKKVLHTVRNWKVLLPQLIVPTFCVAVCLTATRAASHDRRMSQELELTLQSLNLPHTLKASFFDTSSKKQTVKGPTNVTDLIKLFPLVSEELYADISLTNISFVLSNEAPWKQYRTDEDLACLFGDDPFGFLAYEGRKRLFAKERIAEEDLFSALFQEGNAVTTYFEMLRDKLALPPSSMCGIPDTQRSLAEQLLNGYLYMFNNDLKKEKTLSITGAFNGRPYHMPPITLNVMTNTLLKYFLPSARNITVTNRPLPPTTRDNIADARSQQVETWCLAFAFGVAVAFLSATFAIFLIRERQSKSKHLQYVCGTNPILFVFCGLLWDFINFQVALVLTLPVIYAFDLGAFIWEDRWVMVIWMFSVYAAAALPYTYLFSFLYQHPTVGFVKLTILYLLIGSGLLLTVDTMELPQLKLLQIHDVIMWIGMTLSPHYVISEAIRNIGDNFLSAKICEPITKQHSYCSKFPEGPCCPACQLESGVTSRNGTLCLPHTDSYVRMRYPGIGKHSLFMGAQSCVFIAILLLKELGYFQQLGYIFRKRLTLKNNIFVSDSRNDDPDLMEKSVSISSSSQTDPSSITMETLRSSKEGTSGTPNERGSIELDADVAAENSRVYNANQSPELGQQPVLTILNLTKTFGDFTAVNGLSCVVEANDCFGLLGVNGAGKTTTFRMLTGDESISDGNAFINGLSVKDNLKKVRKMVGYCPQFDALVDQMSPKETLWMFCSLRGVPSSEIESLSQSLLDAFQLQENANKMVGTLSGGNKRRVSIAVSLIGNPSMVLLDEPTNGLDPSARRMVWKLLAGIRRRGIPLVLTSHSMEECEALCTRIGIMANGSFKCLGSPQHLKTKFGSGYTLLITVSKLKHVPKVIRRVKRLFNGVSLKQVHAQLLHFHVANESVPWSQIFGRIESLKKSLHITDYSISQTTLEQIFLNFSREQEEQSKSENGPFLTE